MEKIKRIGVLTSGGDCAGLNAVIRAVVHRAIWGYGWEVYGILNSTMGLTHRPLKYRKLEVGDVSTLVLRSGGTMLGTINKGDPFAYPMPDGSKKDLSEDFGEAVRELGLDALVVIGGDGSMNIVSRLCANAGVKMIGIPKTIDNDTPITEHSVGFATARDICVEALDRLQSTAASHRRVMILEVMGRDAGHIAVHSGVAGGADVILVPEVDYTMEGIKEKIQMVYDSGRTHALIVVAEGVKKPSGDSVAKSEFGGEVRYGGIGNYLSERLNEEMDYETRVTVLGHIQRAGTPSSLDRLTAAVFGVHAIDCLAEGKSDIMVAWQRGEVSHVPLADVVAEGTANLDPNSTFVQTARGMGIYIGE